MLYNNIDTINGKIIKKLIEQSSGKHKRIKNLYERYKQTTEGVPILTRQYSIGGVKQEDKINNKVANDFVGEIVDMKVGFFCGIPVTYTLDKSKYQIEKKKNIVDKIKIAMGKDEETEMITSPAYTEDLDIIKDFNKRNSIADLDMETAKRATICGYCGRLLYTDIDGKEKVKLVEPWECIFIGDSIDKPNATIRYFNVDVYNLNGEVTTTTRAEVYTSGTIEYYIKNSNGEYIEEGAAVTHYWGEPPLFGFANNDELMGDADKVLSIIDGYDRTFSDVDSEVEQFRLAYLAFLGASISKEVIKEAQQTGAFGLPEGVDAKFLVKNLDDAIIEHHLDRAERNIYRFSATPNMNDIQFGGNITGVAMKYKFRPFEDKCRRSELKFKKSFRSQYDKLCKKWNDIGIKIDPLNMEFIFTRNYPQNLNEEATWLRDTKGIISEETRFSNVSFIENPEDEIEKLKAEEEENLDNFVERNERLAGTSNQDGEENVNPENTNAIANKATKEDK